jgi:membrane protein
MKGLRSSLAGSFPVRLGRAYGESKAGQYAAGLAFNAFMTMFPLMLGILAIIGLFIRDQGTHQQIQSTLVNFFPGDSHQSISATLRGASQHSGLLGILSIAGLLWSGTGLVVALEFALSEIFGVAQRDFLRQRAMALGMMTLFIAAMVLAVVANVVVSVVRNLPLLGPAVGAIVMIAAMAVLYRVVPNRSFRLREIWMGALLVGVLIEVVTLAFPLYVRLLHGFNTYGAAFALFFLLASWLYFLCQFILLGAVLNRMRIGMPTAEGAVASPGEQLVDTDGSRAAEEHRRDTDGPLPSGDRRQTIS